MIRRIWLRIAVLLFLAVTPALLVMLKLESDAINLSYAMVDSTGVRGALDGSMSFLRVSAREHPEWTDSLQVQFGHLAQAKRSLEEFFLTQDAVLGDIQRQSILIVTTALVLSLLLSYGVARGIVVQVEHLLKEQHQAERKLRDLTALQNWQTLARTLVHELRAPITPIKLVATDLESKYQTLSEQAFEGYLRDSQALVREQINSIEVMIQGFMNFGKLPEPVKEYTSWHSFLNGFVSTYRNAWGQSVTLALEEEELQPDLKMAMDSKLVRDLLFNLCKNAVEANDNKTDIILHSRRKGDMMHLTIRNSGNRLDPRLSETLFEPYVSLHQQNSRGNLGLGLTIARKIALDHGGDLRHDPGMTNGVTFILELPIDSPA